MERIKTPAKIGMKHKLVLLLSCITIITALVFTLLMSSLFTQEIFKPGISWLVAFLSLLFIFTIIFVGSRLSSAFIQRVEQINEVSHAWLRGNLSARIADPTADEVGLLADNLDQLAEHLEEDEKDLSRLSQSNTRLTDQVRALAVVEERNRLARELHDSVKQHLFSLAMTASAIRARLDTMEELPDDVVEMVDEIVSASQNAQRETTRLIEDLRPGSLEERGLAVALNDYTLLFGAQEHLLIYFNVHCNDQNLPSSIAEALYRVAQEALHNVARHAHATRVDMELQCSSGRIALRIEDNGVGFDTTRTGQGLGISNMQERLLSVGGKLSIESQPRIGTTVLAEVLLYSRQDLSDRIKVEPNVADHSHWLWLGERIVIPVGQIWPWLPDDEEKHLKQRKIQPAASPLFVRKEQRFLAIRTLYTLRDSEQRNPICRILRERSGYTWDLYGATWDLQHVRGLYGRGILMRNGQPLAAMQYQGRQMDTFTQIVYHTQVYRLVLNPHDMNSYTLMDNEENDYAEFNKSDMMVNIKQPTPLTLLIMAVTRILDEASVSAASSTIS